MYAKEHTIFLLEKINLHFLISLRMLSLLFRFREV